ncbi:MAG: DUF2961 domain-containing protein [Bacteroidetes bacterium]|nr:DUF2961 domain-containing protein [Bacteroidota bacterium]MDA1122201.1 DUF2961 domain-containing protein [Bacteroidota bacterium]
MDFKLNRYNRGTFLIAFLILLTISLSLAAQQQLTYVDLIDRLTDMEYLATPPMDGEQSGNFSSFDRKATYDEATNLYIDWDANRDGTGYVREEGDGDIVVFEKDGPGVIWRVWSALALTGHVKVFMDHGEEPIIDMTFADFFDQINEYGIELPKSLPGYPSINLPNLMPTLSRGRNRFIPIPYQEHCKIVLEKGWGMYYHITYTTFPNEIHLPDFDGIHRKADCIALAEADRIIANRGFVRKHYASEKLESRKVKAIANKEMVVKTIEGNRAITHFSINYNKNEYIDEKARGAMLKDIWLKITWDGDNKASVMAPIGLFFGTYPDVYPYRAYPIGALPGQLYSNWYMPFSKEAKIEIVNKGIRNHTFNIEIVHAPLDESGDELLRFHSKWHNGKYKEEVQSQGRDKDWPLIVTKGRGRFCGVTLHIQNEWEEPKESTVNWWYGKYSARNIWWWWGEGDEKFYVDGEKFPSTFGTGSEDYIGYAWSAEPAFALFDSGFATQPYTAIDGNGHTIVSRFHVSDNIPFQTSFTAVIDKYKADKWGDKEQDCTVCTNICLYQAVGYWYLMPGQEDGY